MVFNTIQSFFQEHVGEILLLYPNTAKDGEEGNEFAVPSGAWGSDSEVLKPSCPKLSELPLLLTLFC